MLGQHVYIERDQGQAEKKDGLWLSDYYIVGADTEDPFVWAANEKNRLEKRPVVLGKHDDELNEYEIVEGLTRDDCIAFPTDLLEEGNMTEVGDVTQMMMGGADMNMEDFQDPAMMDDEMMMNDMSGEMAGDEFMVEEGTDFGGEEVEGEFSSEDELMPMDGAPGMENEAVMEAAPDMDSEAVMDGAEMIGGFDG